MRKLSTPPLTSCTIVLTPQILILLFTASAYNAVLSAISALHAGQGAVYTYDPVGNFERVGYSCQVKRTSVGAQGSWL